MKRTSILILILIAAATGIVIASFGKFHSYETFEYTAAHPGRSCEVMGMLDKSRKPELDPAGTAARFSFYASDKKDRKCKVIFTGTLPQELEQSKQLILTGYRKDSIFYCSKIKVRG